MKLCSLITHIFVTYLFLFNQTKTYRNEEDNNLQKLKINYIDYLHFTINNL